MNYRMNDNLNLSITGYSIIDTVINSSTGEKTIIKRGNNLIVTNILPLIMSLLKGEMSGIQYFAIGSGDSSWDDYNIPNPNINETQLTNELGRKEITMSDMVFLDTLTGEEVSTPTSKLRISVTFNESECNGEWREFGIFGGNASITPNSGYMIDKKHHALFNKTLDVSVIRSITLGISLY